MSKKDEPKQHRLLSCTFTRDQVTLLASALMAARARVSLRAGTAKGIDRKITESLLKGYGDLLNKLETSPWIY